MAVSVLSRIAQIHEQSATFDSNDWVLKAGELGVERDTDRIKSGDGTSSWTAIAQYLGETASDLYYDPTGTTLVSTDVQSAIDELNEIGGSCPPHDELTGNLPELIGSYAPRMVVSNGEFVAVMTNDPNATVYVKKVTDISWVQADDFMAGDPSTWGAVYITGNPPNEHPMPVTLAINESKGLLYWSARMAGPQLADRGAAVWYVDPSVDPSSWTDITALVLTTSDPSINDGYVSRMSVQDTTLDDRVFMGFYASQGYAQEAVSSDNWATSTLTLSGQLSSPHRSSLRYFPGGTDKKYQVVANGNNSLTIGYDTTNGFSPWVWNTIPNPASDGYSNCNASPRVHGDYGDQNLYCFLAHNNADTAGARLHVGVMGGTTYHDDFAGETDLFDEHYGEATCNASIDGFLAVVGKGGLFRITQDFINFSDWRNYVVAGYENADFASIYSARNKTTGDTTVYLCGMNNGEAFVLRHEVVLA